MKNMGKYILVGVITLALGLLLGKWIFGGQPASAEHVHETAESGNEVWTCSMHPQIRQDSPGTCPICGMDLIPLGSESDDDLNPDAIKMSNSAMYLAQVQTTEVQRGDMVKTIRLNGKIAADERQIYTQSAHLPGRIEQLLVNFTGESVRKGQVIARVYSPELVTAQEELFQAIKLKATTPALYKAAREKLKNWKLTDEQIDAIEAAGKPQETFDLQSDVSGIVLEKKVNLGDYVQRGAPLFTVANLSRVWVLFDAYESDLPWVKQGNQVEFTVASLPGKTFKGRISFIDPIVDPQSRTADVRVEIANPGGQLKPEMFATAELQAAVSGQSDQLTVPKSAVLWTGKRSIVYVQDISAEAPTFMLREVTLGPALGDSYVIENGLKAGDFVVTNGAFAIDAAAQLAGKESMMSAKDQGGLPTKPVAINQSARQELWKVVKAYLQMKNALVASDEALARRHAADLAKAINSVPMSVFGDAAHESWMAYQEVLQDLTQRVVSSNSLAGMRKQFTPLSDRMADMMEVFGPLEAPVFVQFCPMANSNKGGYWLSTEEEIRNPYYGDEMLTCGKVVAEIR
jgi:Cu(I)/Ag(I) efflux system membrane fusion protein